MTYYYNPNPSERFKPELTELPIEFNRAEYLNHAHSKNTKFAHGIDRAVEMSIKEGDTIKKSSLIVVYAALGLFVKKGFSTHVSQQQIAETVSLNKNTVARAIKWLRRAQLITVFHRYSGEGIERRRTTSRTVLTAFVEYCARVKKNKMDQANFKNLINCTVSNVTGEIVSKSTNTVSSRAVTYYIYKTAKFLEEITSIPLTDYRNPSFYPTKG